MINAKFTRLLIDSLCVLTAVMALIVMRGWLVQDSSIVQVRPDFAPMQFNTALCFLLATGAVWFLSCKYYKVSLVLAGACLLIAGISGMQYLLHINTGIDTLFVDPFTTVRTSHAGRMAPNTALNFTLISAGCLLGNPLLKPGARTAASISCGGFVFAIAIVALLGYGTGLDGALIWGEFTRMALHTALGFMLLGVALVLTTLHINEIGNLYEIPWLPHIATSSVLLLVAMIWLALQTTYTLHIQGLLNKHDEEISAVLKTYIDQEGLAIDRLAERSRFYAAGSDLNFEYDADAHIRDFSDLVAMVWLDSNGRIMKLQSDAALVNPEDIEALLTLEPLPELAADELHYRLQQTPSGSTYILIVTAIEDENGISGHVAGFSELSSLFSRIMQWREYPEYVSGIRQDNQWLVAEDGSSDPRWESQASYPFNDLPIDVVIRAAPSLIREWHTYLPTVFLVSGILLALLVAGVLTLIQSTRRMTLELSDANKAMHDSLEETRRARAELEEKSKALADSNRDLENFASIAAHDLKEPLRKVSMFGERLNHHIGDTLDERARQYLDAMINGASRMDNLLDSLLAFSRVTTQGRAFESTDLNKVLADVQSDLSELIRDNDARLVLDELPSVQADPAQMRQLFQNLIANAIRYRKPDISPVIRVDLDSANAQNGELQISVSDNGIGFEQSHADEIFEVFKRLHTRAEYPGTGMGLAVCKRIMERHRGSIRAEGNPGEGARFILTFSRI